VKSWSTKRLEKKVTRAISLEKKMNNQLQNGALLAKYILVLLFFISLNYTLNWLQTFNFVQYCPWWTLIPTPDFRTFFILVLGFGFFNLTSNWPLNFQIFSISPLILTNWVLRVRHLFQNGHWQRISSI
jgi:hypothetical protein